MQSSIIFRNLEGDDGLVKYIDRRLAFSFARTEHAIDSVAVTVTDINGPKGGRDKQVQILIKPTGMNEVIVTERREEIRQAIDRSISRASQTLTRKLKRRRMLLQKNTPRGKSHSEYSVADDAELESAYPSNT